MNLVRRNNRGFTLLEVIAILVIGAILAALVVPYVATSVARSSDPLVQLNATTSAQRTMENIIADYEAGTGLAALKTKIGTGVQDNDYGVYTVVANDYITFAGNSEQPDTSGTNNLLKVSINDGTGHLLTVLLTAP